jgi:glycine oxidase
MKVVIVGAGVAGLAIGWRLAQTGCEVEVLERGLAGRGATWASAGMIAAISETGTDDSAHSHFAEDARAAWPAFAREIEEASGEKIGFREAGALLVAFDEVQEARLRQLAQTLAAKQMPGQWLSAAEARTREPMLAPNLRGALLALDSAQVDNRALCSALGLALRNAGGQLREHCNAQLLMVQGNSARGLVTDDSMVLADAVIIAGGAWCNWLGGVPREVLPPVRPVKGQMVSLSPPNGAKLPQYPAWESDVYIVPRRDRVLVGATVEEVGFDTAVTKEARDWLVAGAAKLAPSLADWPVVESWAGLRPATPDGLPALGPTTLDGLFIATGQFRNGILFAPAVADALRRFVQGEELSPTLRAFDPRRFLRGLN